MMCMTRVWRTGHQMVKAGSAVDERQPFLSQPVCEQAAGLLTFQLTEPNIVFHSCLTRDLMLRYCKPSFENLRTAESQGS
jgi:hypothetical protein